MTRGSRLVLATLLACLAPATVASADEKAPLERVATITLEGPVGGLDHMAFDTGRQRLLVANTANGSLDVVDVASGKLLRQVPGQSRIRGVDYAPDLDRVFVGNGTGGICNVFQGADLRLLKNIALGDNADNVRYNPRTRRIYVVHADRELSVIDAQDYAIGSPIALAKALGAFKIEASRPRMYVNAKEDGLVLVVDARQGVVVDRFPVAPATMNASLAIDEANRRLFVGCRREPSLVVMDSDTGRVVARVPIPGRVDDLWYDSARQRIYASCGDGAIGVVSQLDADHYTHLANLPTATSARTSFFEPTRSRLYLGVPRHADRPDQSHPEIWVYEAHP